jgi:site-specific DNA recombinase
LIVQIDELTARQKNARELLLKGDLDGVEYREIKSECETKINVLEAKISEFSMTNHSIENDLGRAIIALSSINGMVSLEDGKLNRELVGSMYPEKFTFEKLIDRTARVNQVANVIYQINSRLKEKKERASDEKSCLPSRVRPPGLEPGTKRL